MMKGRNPGGKTELYSFKTKLMDWSVLFVAPDIRNFGTNTD